MITKKVSSSIDGSSRKMPASFERKGFELCDSELEMQGFEPCRTKRYHYFLNGYKKEPRILHGSFIVSAERGSRTPMPLRTHAPETCASTNSAISAKKNDEFSARLFNIHH